MSKKKRLVIDSKGMRLVVILIYHRRSRERGRVRKLRSKTLNTKIRKTR